MASINLLSREEIDRITHIPDETYAEWEEMLNAKSIWCDVDTE